MLIWTIFSSFELMFIWTINIIYEKNKRIVQMNIKIVQMDIKVEMT